MNLLQISKIESIVEAHELQLQISKIELVEATHYGANV